MHGGKLLLFCAAVVLFNANAGTGQSALPDDMMPFSSSPPPTPPPPLPPGPSHTSSHTQSERPRKANNYEGGIRTAIVTTVRRPPKAMWNDFLCYHLGIGFDHLFIFHDDPDDAVCLPGPDFVPADTFPFAPVDISACNLHKSSLQCGIVSRSSPRSLHLPRASSHACTRTQTGNFGLNYFHAW